jgi:uncharacterized membrane protein YhaH (DUF805 family)
MGPAQAIRTGLAKSFQISGRASRSEFWWFAVFCAFAGFFAAALDYWLFTPKVFLATGELVGIASTQTIGKLWAVVATVALLTAALRRTNDTQSGKVIVLLAGLVALGVTFLLINDYFGVGRIAGGIISAGSLPSPSTAWRAFALAVAVPLVIPLVGAWWLTRPSAYVTPTSRQEASP